MDKTRLILFLGAIAVLVYFGYQTFFGETSAGTDSGETNWQTIALSLQEDNKKLKQENTHLKQKSADITADQQKISKNAEAFLRAYFEYDQNSDRSIKNRVGLYSTQKLLSGKDIPNVHIEEGNAEESSSAPNNVVAKISKLNIYHSTITNTSASVYADVSQDFRTNNFQNTSALIAKLTLVYDVSKQTWLVDTINIQPALPEDRMN